MLFRNITLSDKARFQQAAGRKEWLACEYHFAHLFLWKDSDGIQIAEEDGVLYFKEKRVGSYLVPVCADPAAALDKLIAHCRAAGERFVIYSGYAELAEELKDDPRFCIRHERTYDDYLYRASDLIDLPGKKYHAKRNHIARYEREAAPVFAPYTEKDRRDCLLLEEDWVAAHDYSETALAEQQAIENALNHMDFLGLTGGVLRVDGRLAGFTVGQRADDKMAIIHFEKCAPGCEGAYPGLNQAYAARFCREMTYINREDDMGLAGLRKAKESYYPVAMVEKYKITLAAEEEADGHQNGGGCGQSNADGTLADGIL